MDTVRMENMNWPDIKEKIENGYTTAIFAIGSIEQHGPHLPLITDTMIGDVLALKVAEKLGNALQAPTIRVGLSEHQLTFPGSMSLKPETLRAVASDFVDCLKIHGFKTIILLPSHGGNFTTAGKIIEELQQKHEDLKIVGYTDLLPFVNTLMSFSEEFGVPADEAGAHAGENETSFILALAGNLVRTDRYTPGYVGPLGEKEVSIIYEQGMPALTKNGIVGDPTTATAVKGEVYIEKMSDFLVEELNKLLKT